MREFGNGARLMFKALSYIGLRGEPFRQDLNGNVATQAGISGPVHFPHAAGTQWGENFVGTQSYARSERH
jgi:hypothetical protein